jgi:membrane protease YdiL (CAAX protease family)
MDETTARLRSARRSFSIVGFGFTALIAMALVAQVALVLLPELLGWNELEQKPWWIWVCAFVPMYLFAYPTGYLVLRALPGQPPQRNKLTATQFFSLIPVCLCLTYAGSLVGNLLSSVLSGGEAVNALDEFAMDQSPWKILLMVILAPLVEEWICRKLLIDRIGCYGEKLSVLMSGLIFGLLHQNLFQFFYAFAVGCLFAYVYVRTGRIWYTVVLHAIVNFLGAVVAPVIMSLSPEETTAETVTEMVNLGDSLKELLSALLVSAYGMCLLGFSIFGLVLIIRQRKKLAWNESDNQLSRKQAMKAAFLNAGMIIYVIICLAMTVLALFNG